MAKVDSPGRQLVNESTLSPNVPGLPEQLLRLLRQTLGAKVELLAYEVANRHHDYLVLLAQLRRPTIKIVIKLAGPEAPLACPFDRTATLHDLVRARTAIAMPEILAVDVSYQNWPWRYLIKTHVPGQEWRAIRPGLGAPELASAYRQIGAAVAQLHALHFPAFGELAVDGTVQGSDSCITALRRRARSLIKRARLQELFSAVLDERMYLFSDVRQASLCHEDLHGRNLIFQRHKGQWRLATILDFDKAWAGHHETDLARLDLWQGMTSAAFWRTYRALGSVEPLYEQRKPIYQLLWCLEYARPTSVHLADTRRLCVELCIPPIEQFE